MAVTRREVRLCNCRESITTGYSGAPVILRHAETPVFNFDTLKRVLESADRTGICRAACQSGLTEWGGSSCVGEVWQAAQAAGTVICNAAGFEPGCFKERVLLETSPFRLIEALAIAGYAADAREGIIFLPQQGGMPERIQSVIAEAQKEGFLGRNIQNSGFNFNIRVFAGTGGYICREESALRQLMQGGRAEPMPGNGEPPIIHTIEALFQAAEIVENGASPERDTRLFSVSGDVLYPGLYEAPYGSTLRELIFRFAGGMADGGRLKAALVGGPGGICAGAPDIDRRLESKDLPPGSGAITVLSQSRCMVDTVQGIAAFFKDESCGLCTPCRVGTKRLHEVLSWWKSGAGDAADLKLVQGLGEVMQDTCGCSVGRSAANIFMTSLGHFYNEYQMHLAQKSCPANVCRPESKEI